MWILLSWIYVAQKYAEGKLPPPPSATAAACATTRATKDLWCTHHLHLPQPASAIPGPNPMFVRASERRTPTRRELNKAVEERIVIQRMTEGIRSLSVSGANRGLFYPVEKAPACVRHPYFFRAVIFPFFFPVFCALPTLTVLRILARSWHSIIIGGQGRNKRMKATEKRVFWQITEGAVGDLIGAGVEKLKTTFKAWLVAYFEALYFPQQITTYWRKAIDIINIFYVTRDASIHLPIHSHQIVREIRKCYKDKWQKSWSEREDCRVSRLL